MKQAGRAGGRASFRRRTQKGGAGTCSRGGREAMGPGGGAGRRREGTQEVSRGENSYRVRGTADGSRYPRSCSLQVNSKQNNNHCMMAACFTEVGVMFTDNKWTLSFTPAVCRLVRSCSSTSASSPHARSCGHRSTRRCDKGGRSDGSEGAGPRSWATAGLSRVYMERLLPDNCLWKGFHLAAVQGAGDGFRWCVGWGCLHAPKNWHGEAQHPCMSSAPAC